MSSTLTVYCKNLSSELVPNIVKRLNDFDMVVEIHPDFAFHQENDSGFVPFKFLLKAPYFDELNNKYLKTGFELYIEDFDLQQTKDALRPELSFGIAREPDPHDEEFAKKGFEQRLQHCDKVVHFVWNSADTFEIRFASMTSAILTELTNGVCCYPADNIWFDNNNIVEQAYKEASEYEKSIQEKDFEFHEFDGW